MATTSIVAELRLRAQRLLRWIAGPTASQSLGFEAIADATEQGHFLARNAAFIERSANLKTALPAAFPIGGAVKKDEVPIYLLSRIAVEDFREVLTLAGNGMGIGSYKILRGMFDRCQLLTSRQLLRSSARTVLPAHAA